MEIVPTGLKDALLIKLQAHGDHRGFFKEVFRANEYARLTDAPFVQENMSYSPRNVLRGLHYDPPMAKLVQVIYGRTFHVIVDLRRESPTYLKWESFDLSGDVHTQVFVPGGFANGFYVVSDFAYVHYKQTTYYNPATERILRWNDPVVGVKWPSDNPILSERDRTAPDYRSASE
jgi:dTDP-4-dehydrorhamnose 3,5-epimerase